MARFTRLLVFSVFALTLGCNDNETTAEDDIAIALNSSSETIEPGGSTTVTVTISRTTTTIGAVTLTATGLPTGVSATFAPATIPDGSTASELTLTASAGATPGSGTITIRGTGADNSTGARPLDLIVSGGEIPSIILAVSPTIMPIARGGNVSSTVTITRSGGFTGSVALAIDGLPTGVTAAFAPGSIPNGATSSSLTITAAPGATLGTSYLTLHATGAGIAEQAASLQLTVNASLVSATGARQ